jgi:hypothetical protein
VAAAVEELHGRLFIVESLDDPSSDLWASHGHVDLYNRISGATTY